MAEPEDLRPPRMTADELLDWTVEQPKRPRYEVVMMVPECPVHIPVKARV